MSKTVKPPDFSDKLMAVSKSLNGAGNKLTKKLTFPIILFILGVATFPFGIVLWLIALYLIAA